MHFCTLSLLISSKMWSGAKCSLRMKLQNVGWPIFLLKSNKPPVRIYWNTRNYDVYSIQNISRKEPPTHILNAFYAQEFWWYLTLKVCINQTLIEKHPAL